MSQTSSAILRNSYIYPDYCRVSYSTGILPSIPTLLPWRFYSYFGWSG